jgi:GSH-dependent disulfide-bond oxidoreductase
LTSTLVINIGKGDQFKSGFVDINPNSKIPALLDKEGPDGKPIHLFESGSIVQYLAEKYHKFIPSDARLRAEVTNWIFWQVNML